MANGEAVLPFFPLLDMLHCPVQHEHEQATPLVLLGLLHIVNDFICVQIGGDFVEPHVCVLIEHTDLEVGHHGS